MEEWLENVGVDEERRLGDEVEDRNGEKGGMIRGGEGVGGQREGMGLRIRGELRGNGRKRWKKKKK